MYALVCVDVPHEDVDRVFHYAVPPQLSVAAGMRVRVPFGRGNKRILGHILGLSPSPGDIPAEKIKPIAEVCDAFPVLDASMLQLAQWMQGKYYTTLAACIRAITPTARANGKWPATRKKFPEKAATSAALTLNAEQAAALAAIRSADTPVLLHGVTGSGKTEVYMQAIADVLASGRTAIVLVPEIALTPQTVGVFTARFGSQVGVTHSRMTAGERFAVWDMARRGSIRLVIGPRSAVFSPLAGLGLIVIDEEHEHTYHSEISPKLDARTVAIYRAGLCGAGVVLGSATPSLESYTRAMDGQYKLATMLHRVNMTFPAVHIMDMRQELQRGNTTQLAVEFQNALARALDAGGQAILFLNRRGFASFVSCRKCGHVMACDACRVNFTYHKGMRARLLCHYCGREAKMPELCPACESPHITHSGTGTQKIEEEIRRLFPAAKTLRMDTDTTRGKDSHARILDAFRSGAADILIGTQMVAKGLDFPNVTFVGVIAADMGLYTGDFRSAEHTFQLLTQVAGRAGRAGKVGEVYLQTFSPSHYAVIHAKNADYAAFYKHEIALRRTMVYPPFSHVFSVMFTGPAEREVIHAVQKLQATMQYVSTRDGSGRFDIIGISPCFVSMVKKKYRWKILVKCREEAPLVSFVIYCIGKLRDNDPLKDITIHLHLNPVTME